jgi:hypothetical protein
VIVLVQEAENWAERRSGMMSIGGPQKFNAEMDRAFNSLRIEKMTDHLRFPECL